MKFLKLSIAVAAVLVFVFSCSKTDSSIGPSVGTLKINDTSGDCALDTAVYGTYTAGTALTGDNYIDIDINVTAVGSYDIETDSSNGIYFKGIGRVGYTGKNRIRLYGYGKPVNPGISTFNVHYGNDLCSVAVIVVGAPKGSFLVKDTSGIAFPAPSVNGIYTTGVPLNSSDSVVVSVFVTQPGLITLTSNLADGISFSGSGVFQTTGIQTITLAGNGIPQTAGSYNFSVLDSLSDSSKFTVTVVPFGGGAASASYTLGGAPGVCSGFTVYGNYQSSTKFNSGDSVTTQVDVTKAGAYSIVTNQANGAVFSATGVFDSAGMYTVALKGIGVPVNAGTYNYTATGDSSSCTFSISFAQGLAIYSLGGTPNDCTGFILNGTYKTDSALTSNSTVTLEVNVVSPGNYSISTTNVDGMVFSASGSFDNVGEQTVVLTGTGTPVSPGIYNFVTSSRTGNCIFSIVVQPSTAEFTLGNSAYGNCTGFVLKGTYVAGTALTAANTATMQVNVTHVGPYTISTDTSDGMVFTAAGIFNTTGTQTVVLSGSGKPTLPGSYILTPQSGSSTCSFTVNVTGTGGGGSGTAVYSLGGSPNSCSGFTSNGTYTSGTALTSGNTVSLQVNVTTAGTYSISTSAVNGISFSGSGNFSSTGQTTITLTGNGTPAAAGSFNYTTAGGAGNCTFSITAVAGTITASFAATINGTAETFNTNASATVLTTPLSTVNMTGNASSSSVESLSISVAKSTGTVTDGTYNQNDLSSGIVVAATYLDPSSNSYFAGTSNNLLTITITNITATEVQGSFSGTLKNNNGAGPGTVTITNGTFTLPVQ